MVSSPDKAVEGAEAVAFDVFGTLTCRPFLEPRDLFGYLEDEFSAPGFAEARVKAERKAREKDRETRLEGIYSSMDSMYARMMKEEIRAEVSLSFADPEAKNLFERARSSGKRIVLVSDMYLSSGTISDILEHCGYSGWERLFVSCEEKISKRNGLWKNVLAYLGLSPHSVAVIGDGPNADIGSSAALGMDAVRWIPMTERYLSRHRSEARFAEKNPCWQASAVAAMDMLSESSSDKDEAYMHKVSRRFGGPMNAVFARFIVEHTQKAEELLFLSRDGYMPMRSWETLYGGRAHAYLHTSRMMARIFGSPNWERRDAVLSMADYMLRRGIIGPNEASRRDWRRFAEEHREEMDRLSAEGRVRCAKHIVSAAGSPVSAAVVDATTKSFTAQRDLSDYMRGTELEGCYYAVTAEGGPDHSCYADRSEQKLSSTYVNLTEFFMASGEPPLDDFNEDGEPVPATQIPEDERIREEAFPQIEAGIMDCVKLWKDVFGQRVPRIDWHIMDSWLDVLIAEEHGNDPCTLSGMKWAVDTRHVITRHLIVRWTDLPRLAAYKVAVRAYNALAKRRRTRRLSK
ncbi:hypothetical protein O8W32_02615 [Methanomassiliicoccales archaeon LGM-DZ1]|nr:hypothetical protein O8W32_02615 [Methanomassiliicoccales archaeon LGM-DZ1]